MVVEGGYLLLFSVTSSNLFSY